MSCSLISLMEAIVPSLSEMVCGTNEHQLWPSTQAAVVGSLELHHWPGRRWYYSNQGAETAILLLRLLRTPRHLWFHGCAVTRVFCHCIYGHEQVSSGIRPGIQWERVLIWGKALRKEIQAPFSCYLTGTCLWPVTLPPDTSFFTSHCSTRQGGVTGNSFSHSLTLCIFLSHMHTISVFLSHGIMWGKNGPYTGSPCLSLLSAFLSPSLVLFEA